MITIFGKSVSLYYAFWFIAMVSALITGWCLRKDYGLSFSKATSLVSLDLILGYFLIWITSWLFGGFKVNGFNFVRIVSFVPLYAMLLAYLFKEPLWKILDYLTPVGAIFFGISRFGCMMQGCCHGYPSEWGIYSSIAKAICFPIQPIEAAVSLLIGMILYWMAKMKYQQGNLYPWFMISFGGTRFLLEFFRDNRKVWHNVSELAFHALAAFILGIIMVIVNNLRSKRVANNEEN